VLLEDSTPDVVVQRYRALVFERERQYGHRDDAQAGAEVRVPAPRGSEVPVVRCIPNIDHRFGNGDAEVLGVELLNEWCRPTRDVLGGQSVVIRVSAQFNRDVDRPILGYTMRDRLGVEVSACNTSYAGQILPPACKGEIYTSDFRVVMPHMAVGSYSISPAVARGDILKHDMCDWIDNALVFTLGSDDMIYGMLKMDVSVVNYAVRP